MRKSALILIFLLFGIRSFGQFQYQDWDISAGVGGHYAYLHFKEVNYAASPSGDVFANNNIRIGGGNLEFAIHHKIDSFMTIGVSVRGLEDYFTLNSNGSADLQSGLYNFNTSISLNKIFKAEKTLWAQNFKPYIGADVGYGVSNLDIDESNQAMGNGFEASIFAGLEFKFTEDEFVSLLGGLKAGYLYYKAGNFTGDASNEFQNLNLDFSGIYWALTIKVTFGRNIPQ